MLSSELHAVGLAGPMCLLALTPTAAETPLRDKTLVVWVAPAHLEQRGGSALTLDDLQSHFDGIIFGELAPRKWMPGSDAFRRSEKDQSNWPEETAGPDTFVQVAIVYRGAEVTMYRNGQPVAAYTMVNAPQEFGPQSVVVFGMRHLDQGDNARFAGAVDDARIYDVALSSDQIAALHPNQPSDPQPWAWWTFEEDAQDRTGRFAAAKLVGGAAVKEGRLVLDGQSGTLVAAQTPTALAAVAQVAEPVPQADIEAARRLRHHLLTDPYRPTYHLVTPEGLCGPFDPNGALFWNGRYHLMYIAQTEKGHCWAHVSSQDLVHWRHHPLALKPGEGDEGIFSGGAFIDRNGVATLTYWGLGHPRGICIATSTDDHLDRWTKSPHNPVIRETAWGYAAYGEGEEEVVYGAADPSAIWTHNGRYYLLTGNLLVLQEYGQKRQQTEHLGDTLYLFVSDDLVHWEYLHPFYQSDRKWTRDFEDNMCPDFFPLPASPQDGPPSDKHLILFISHSLGCQYYLGRYAHDRFEPEAHGRMTWVDNAFFAPESLVDDRGRRIMWAWIFDGRSQPARHASGWSGTMSLPRVLWLGEDKTLRLRPAEELEQLRTHEQTITGLTVAADQEVVLEKIAGNTMELWIEMEPQGARQCGVKVGRSPNGQEQTVVYYDAEDKKLKIDVTQASLGQGPRNVEAGPFELRDGETLTLRVFIDKSVVEAFANDRQAAMRHIYPTRPDSVGVSLFSQGGPTQVRQVRAWEMFPANPY